jgi:hypothetical protein
MAVDPDVVAATERWFLKRGLPHFIDGYSASRDIWTRAVPVLTALFLLELLLAFKAGWSWWLDALALAGAFAIAVGAWALANRARGRSLFARPVDIGPYEIAVFVVVPAIVPIVFGTQFAQAASLAVANVVLLALIYGVTSYGLVPMTRWGIGMLGKQIESVFSLFVRALPLLILVLALLLFTTEVWQTAAELNVIKITVVVVLFMAIGAAFALGRVPRQIGELSTFDSWSVAKDRCAGSPIAGVVDGLPEPSGDTPPLTRRQWNNVGLVVIVSEAVQVLLVTLLIFVFFVLFGVLTITQGVQYSWVGRSLEPLWNFKVHGDNYVLTEELLKVSIFLAAFSGLYFVVVLLTDATYREEFLERVVGEVREAFAVRAAYLEYLRSGE